MLAVADQEIAPAKRFGKQLSVRVTDIDPRSLPAA
jgi:hypothetical protein